MLQHSSTKQSQRGNVSQHPSEMSSCAAEPYSLTLKSQGFIKKQKKGKTTLTNDDQEMQKKCIKKAKKRQLVKKSAYQKAKKLQKETKKKQKKTQTAVQTKANKTHKKCTCTTKFHTPPFLCDFFRCLLHFMCDFLHFFAFFVRFLCVFLRFFAFSQGNAQKMQKKSKTKTQIQSKKMQRQRPERF